MLLSRTQCDSLSTAGTALARARAPRVLVFDWKGIFWHINMAPAYSKFAITEEEYNFAREDLPNRIKINEEGNPHLNWGQRVCLIGQPNTYTLFKIYYRDLSTFLNEHHWIQDARHLRANLARAGVIVPNKNFNISIHTNGTCLLVSLRFSDWRIATPGCLPFDQLVAF